MFANKESVKRKQILNIIAIAISMFIAIRIWVRILNGAKPWSLNSVFVFCIGPAFLIAGLIGSDKLTNVLVKKFG